MKTLVVSDLHANDAALTAVMNHVRRKRPDRIICMGDFVGYGAQPNQVLDRMRTFKGPKLYVRGNHDRVASGADEGEGFNFAARTAALWTRSHLSGPNRKFLQSLPLGPITDGKGTLICHGSPYDEDEYLFSEYDAHRIFSEFEHKLILFGHTHLPCIFVQDEQGNVEGMLVRGPATIPFEPGRRYIVNPGSVGQPRDRNPASSYALIDEKRHCIQFLRVDYDYARTQEAILRAGFPRILSDRLAVGT